MFHPYKAISRVKADGHSPEMPETCCLVTPDCREPGAELGGSGVSSCGSLGLGLLSFCNRRKLSFQSLDDLSQSWVSIIFTPSTPDSTSPRKSRLIGYCICAVFSQMTHGYIKPNLSENQLLVDTHLFPATHYDIHLLLPQTCPDQ